MINLDYSDLQDNQLSQEVIAQVIYQQKIVLIDNFPHDDLQLNSFVNAIGTPIIDFRSGTSIFDVTIRKNKRGFRSVANSHQYFSLHTDCADFANIPNGLVMLCVTPADVGGETLVVKLSQLIAQLSQADLDYALTKKWAFRNEQRCILNNNAQGYSICYNRIIIEGHNPLTSEEWQFLDRFDALLANNAVQFALTKNQLLVCHNHTVLHGRTDFADGSERLIKRIRFDFKNT